jgi:cutinase
MATLLVSLATTLLILASSAVSSPLPEPAASASTSCTPYAVLFARGTTETGTLGTVVGPGLQSAVASALGSSNVQTQVNTSPPPPIVTSALPNPLLYPQGVNYPADFAGIASESFPGSCGPGCTAMASQAKSLLSACPSTTLVLAGYSQGAMVVHNAAQSLATAQIPVGAAVTFGDPFKAVLPAGVAAARFRSFCGPGDEVCGTGSCAGAVSSCASGSTLGHLGYGADVGTAAAFIKSAMGGSGAGGSTSTSNSAVPASGTTGSAPATSTAATATGGSNFLSGLLGGFDLGKLPLPFFGLGNKRLA